MPRISVIVPVYNSERLLGRCLDSLCGQTFDDIEIVCVNDASTDSSHLILDEYSRKDPRVRIFSFSANRGVSVARNTGIENAVGEYVAFVDSDDRVDSRFLEWLWVKSDSGRHDIVKGIIRSEDLVSGKVSSPWHGMDVDALIQKQHRAYFLYGFTSAMFRRKLLVDNDIRFPEGLIINEDPVFTAKAVLLAGSIGFVRNAEYYYSVNSQSVTHNDITSGHLESQVRGTDIILDMLDANGADGMHRAIVSMLLLDHLMYWCERTDVPVTVTGQAVSELDRFRRSCPHFPEVLRQMFLYRKAYYRRKSNEEILAKLRKNAMKNA